MEKDVVSIKATCPIRIDFTGGFTDVLPYRRGRWVEHINLAVNMPITIESEFREDKKISINSADHNILEECGSCDDIPEQFSLIKTAIKKLNIRRGLNICIKSKAPMGAGLGSSGAFCVSLIAALTLLSKKTLPNNITETALLAAEIERDSGVLAGLQDEFASALGGLNCLRFSHTKHSVEPIELTEDQIKKLEENLYILFPGGERKSADIVSAVMEEFSKNNLKVVAALHVLNELSREIRKALRNVDLIRLSELLGLVRREQLKLHPKLADEGNRKIVNDLQTQGIDGVKFLGGGGDGACLLVLCTNKRSHQIIQYVSRRHDIAVLPVQAAVCGVQVQINARESTI